MAGFHTKTFEKHDIYLTPKYAWENINQYIPKDKIIWEAFYDKNETSAQYLRELGCKEVIHEDIDFFENDKGEVIISNPPFSKCKEIVPRLKELNKPFILIMPVSKLNTSYMRNSFKDAGLQIIIPRTRIHFTKLVDGEVPENWKNACNFEVFYYCWKMNLPSDIVWLE